MNEVFNFQENESYNLRSGKHLASRNMHTAYFGTDIIFSLGTKQWNIMPDKNDTCLNIISFQNQK